MSEDLKDRFFNVMLHNLNYAMEFVNDGSYASLRFMDLFNNLLELQPLIKEISKEEFYERLRERIGGERVGRSKLQIELLQMFIDEWRRRTSQT
jgi:hypothetical protein